jgi:prepilin-type N-terminal cleavage/methylation domain-containing protein
MLKNKITKENKKDGFTLIELLVSISIFSIVVVIVLGAVITIADANRKSRSLMTVMNNLNFAVDSMTRSFKTGSDPNSNPISGYDECYTTDEIDYGSTSDADSIVKREVSYCWDSDDGALYKIVGGSASPLTSPDIEITSATFNIPSSGQPILFINLQGLAEVSTNVSSEFTIQTTVSQRRLEP